MKYNSYLIRLLQEEVESARADASAVRNSVRYRVGGLVIQALPPSVKSLRALRQLIQLLLARRKSSPITGSAALITADLAVNNQAPKWVLSLANDNDGGNAGIWVTNNAQLLAEHADKTAEPKILVLRELSTVVVRRIARLQLQGWHIVWHPQPHTEYDAAMLGYVVSIADEYYTGEPT